MIPLELLNANKPIEQRLQSQIRIEIDPDCIKHSISLGITENELIRDLAVKCRKTIKEMIQSVTQESAAKKSELQIQKYDLAIIDRDGTGLDKINLKELQE